MSAFERLLFPQAASIRVIVPTKELSITTGLPYNEVGGSPYLCTGNPLLRSPVGGIHIDPPIGRNLSNLKPNATCSGGYMYPMTV